jgi:hypothetical protein
VVVDRPSIAAVAPYQGGAVGKPSGPAVVLPALESSLGPRREGALQDDASKIVMTIESKNAPIGHRPDCRGDRSRGH